MVPDQVNSDHLTLKANDRVALDGARQDFKANGDDQVS